MTVSQVQSYPLWKQTVKLVTVYSLLLSEIEEVMEKVEDGLDAD